MHASSSQPAEDLDLAGSSYAVAAVSLYIRCATESWQTISRQSRVSAAMEQDEEHQQGLAAPIAADDDVSSTSGDSGYSETTVSTTSLRSSIYDYETRHGRSYHAFHAGKYIVPNDELEQERMNLHYHALRLSMGDKLYHAPISQSPGGILDVGTGTGIWAIDAADAHPSAHVIGFDLSPIQPTWVPPNLHFEVVDADEPWGYQAKRFDLVHTRFMNGFSIRSWPHFYSEAFSCLKPGGWVENQEFDCQMLSDDKTIPEKSYAQDWVRLWNEGAAKAGATGRCYPGQMEAEMRDAGFVNVHRKTYKMPIGPWPKDALLKEAGLFGLVALLEGMSGLSVKIFVELLGWQHEELEVFLAEVRNELKKKAIHMYWPVYIILGQRPPEADDKT